jgi:lipopolysaccharide export system permease protein
MIIYRHILRAHLAPFFGSFFIVMFLFLLQFVMKFMDQLAGKGLSGAVIIELMMLNLAWMVVLAVPMAVLVATLMAFGGLSSNSEITAMKAGGVSLYAMMAPVVAASLLVTYSMIEFNNTVLPEANHRLKTLLMDIHRKKPTLTLIPGLFSQDLPGYSILVRKTFEESNNLEGVTIFDHTDPSKNVVITARRGILSFSADYRKLVMDLYDGEIHELSLTKSLQYRKVLFARQKIATHAEGFDFERSSTNAFSRGDRELSAGVMRYIVDSLKQQLGGMEKGIASFKEENLNRLLTGSPGPRSSPNQNEWRSIDQYTSASSQIMMEQSIVEARFANYDYLLRIIKEYLVEIYKKYSIPWACFVFVLIGAPLGVMARRGGFGVAASLSLGFFLLYWASLIGGEKLADREIMEPWVGMWMANIFMGILGVLLTLRINRENVELNLDFFKRLIPSKMLSSISDSNPQ